MARLYTEAEYVAAVAQATAGAQAKEEALRAECAAALAAKDEQHAKALADTTDRLNRDHAKVLATVLAESAEVRAIKAARDAQVKDLMAKIAECEAECLAKLREVNP